jgi:hypothetical protein
VVDRFHLGKLGNDAVTKVRRRVTWELRDHRAASSIRSGPTGVGCCGRERLSQSSFARMWNTIIDEDPRARILSAWIAKEELRTLLSTVRIGGDTHLTRHHLNRFLTWRNRLPYPRTTHPRCHQRHVVARNQHLYDSTAGKQRAATPDFTLARLKSKTTYGARRGGTERGAGEC